MKYLEDIKIPIKVGDTILGGRFKNKKIVVKEIGKNQKGDITINGKPLLKYRIIKEMKYLKLFENFQNDKISLFDKEGIENIIPKELTVINSEGEWTLKYGDLSILPLQYQICWYQNTPEDVQNGDVNADGEPDTLEFDIHIIKDNDGTVRNSDNLKLLIHISYGDTYVSHFSIQNGKVSKDRYESENNLGYKKYKKGQKIDVTHYTGNDSLYDSDTIWSLTDDSITKIVNFFNRWSEDYKLTNKDFTFLDSDPNSYKPDTKYLGPNN